MTTELMTDKERVLNIFSAHISCLNEEILKANAKFGAAILNEDTYAAKEYGNKSRVLEGQKYSLEMALDILSMELA